MVLNIVLLLLVVLPIAVYMSVRMAVYGALKARYSFYQRHPELHTTNSKGE